MPEAQKEVSAIGYSITANIDAHRQIVFQHFIAADASDAQVNSDLDRIMGLVDRQRARYEIPDLEEELRKLQDEVSQYSEDMAVHAEGNHRKAQADLDVQIETLQRQRKDAYDTAYNQFRTSGRQGSFEPKGHTKQQLERIDAGIAQCQEAKGRNDAERDVYVQNIGANIQRRKDRIEILTAKLADLRVKVT